MLRIYNSLEKKIEEFRPLNQNKVLMYVCGPTVYDDAHIGHGRAYTAFDIVYRHLKYLDFEVCYVRNLTDIDDKIIQKAKQSQVDIDDLTTEYTESFHRDMKALQNLSPDIEPRATQSIPEMIEMIQGLIEKGYAYESEGDVYFSVRKQNQYGKLSQRNIDDLRSGARVEPGEKKKDPLDFVMWKSSKADEPSWPSPWGNGRPGWHIECSAMAKKHLGETIDIHAGGRDLIFPHHENEIAQSESCNEKTFARYWLHNGFVNLSKEKMSKSLGNTVWIKDMLRDFHPEAVRLFYLSSHYRSPIDYSEDLIKQASASLDRLYRLLLDVKPSELPKDWKGHEWALKYEEAMNEDFNTPKALSVLYEMARQAHRKYEEKSYDTASLLSAMIQKLGSQMGLLEASPREYFQALLVSDEGDRKRIEKLIEKRNQARRDKDFSLADQIRDQLSQEGIVLEDSPHGTTWRKQ